MNERDWYVVDQGKPRGPCTLDEIREFAASGAIGGNTAVWRHPMPDWLPLREVRELAAHVPPPLPDTAPIPASRTPREPESSPPPVSGGNGVGPHPAADRKTAAATLVTDPGTETQAVPAYTPRELPPFAVLAPWADGTRPAEEPDEEIDPVRPGEKTRPWRRWFARTADYTMFAVLLGAVIGTAMLYMAPDISRFMFESEYSNWFLTLLVVGAWVPVEGYLMGRYGTTPGKWLLSLRVTAKSGRRLTALAARRRASLVWLNGMGCGAPIVTAITQLVAVTKLERRGETDWDNELGTAVRSDALKPGRVLGAALIVIAAVYFGTL